MVGGCEAGLAGLWAVRAVFKEGIGGCLLYLQKHWFLYRPERLLCLDFQQSSSLATVVVLYRRSEVRGLDRRVVETKLKLSRRGARTTMGHAEVAMQWSYSYWDDS